MKRLVITRTAFKDIASIWSYIAADSPDAADRVRDDIEAAMRALAEMPGMGHVRADVMIPSYRFWRVHSYIIAYRVKGATLFVSRVVHGAQDFRRLFKRSTRRRR